MNNRVRRPSYFDDIFNRLIEKKIFCTFKDIIIFAALVGYKKQRRLPFQKNSEPIAWQVFHGKFDQTILNSLAFKETNDLKILSEENMDKKILILEEYACGGLEILKNEIFDTELDWELALTSLILDQNEPPNLVMELAEAYSPKY